MADWRQIQSLSHADSDPCANPYSVPCPYGDTYSHTNAYPHADTYSHTGGGSRFLYFGSGKKRAING